jgi:carbonic anhydrase
MSNKGFKNPILEETFNKIKAGNDAWVSEVASDTTGLFKELAKSQRPEILWIGCADSRVPANQITHTRPGDVFVHRNIANMCIHSDMNMLSVLDYAVNVLKVKHVIVAGHYGRGGVAAALSQKQFGLIDNWLCHIKDVYRLHKGEIDAITDPTAKVNRLVELNVAEQVFNLCTSTIIQNAWKERDDIAVHGMVIELETGKLIDLDLTFTESAQLDDVFAYK